MTQIRRPIPDSYVVQGSTLAAGAYPGSPPQTKQSDVLKKLDAFLDAGINAFIDLTGPADGMADYADSAIELAEKRGLSVTHERFHIPDMGVCDAERMNTILDAIDDAIAADRGVYLHCWGGVGRTGTVIGCWIVRHGKSGEEALREVQSLFRSMSAEKWERHKRTGSPQTDEQRAMVREWASNDSKGLLTVAKHWEELRPRANIEPAMRDRMRGALIGLAVGDAVGTTVEFMRPGTFALVNDMVGGGPFRLKAGDWTDDTSMALCLAESLIECREFNAEDQMLRYCRWWREGHLSSTGTCFDIGSTVSRALRTFEKTSNPFSGSTDEQAAGNGSLMRLAPIPVFYFGQHDDAIERAAESSRTTHGAPVAVDACRYLAALIIGALQGASKDELLSAHYEPVTGYWTTAPLHPVIAAIANGSFKHKSPPAIRGTGYAADSLEAALWAFDNSNDFREGCLLATNLGDDADTTAAIYGQIAGAFYGESGIPAEWRNRLTHKSLIDRFAEQLFQLSFDPLPPLGARTAQARADAEQLIVRAGGDVAAAIRELIDSEQTAKQEMGVMAYMMNGPMHAQAVLEETLLQLRVELGLSLIR